MEFLLLLWFIGHFFHRVARELYWRGPVWGQRGGVQDEHLRQFEVPAEEGDDDA